MSHLFGLAHDPNAPAGSINGLIEAGSGITITGSGTAADPYDIIANVSGPAGSNTDIQFNNMGVFGGSNNATVDASGNGYFAGNVGIGTSTPAYSLSLYQKTTTDGFQLTGDSVGGTSTGTGFLITLGFNYPGNKQLWLGDPDYQGLSTGYFTRYLGGGGVAIVDVVRGDNAAYGALELGLSAGSRVAVGSGSSFNSQPGSQLWVNNGVAIGSGYRSYTAPTDGLLIAGSVGIGNTSPTSLFSVGSSSQFQVNSSGNIVSLNGATTNFPSANAVGAMTNDGAGNLSYQVAPKVVTKGDLLVQTAAVSSVMTAYTTPNDATTHTYRVNAYTAITAISAGTLTVQVSFTDENNTSRTISYFPMGLTSASLTTTGFDAFTPCNIRCKPNTAITLLTTFTGVSITYDVGGYAELIY